MIRWTNEALSQQFLSAIQYERDPFKSLKVRPEYRLSKVGIQGHHEFKEVESCTQRIFERDEFKARIRSKEFIQYVEQMHSFFSCDEEYSMKYILISRKIQELEYLEAQLSGNEAFVFDEIKKSTIKCEVQNCEKRGLPKLGLCPYHIQWKLNKMPLSVAQCRIYLNELLVSVGINVEDDMSL
ncbi:hypothetical protein ACOME3_005618 [Neoechinorhynchus agilis]